MRAERRTAPYIFEEHNTSHNSASVTLKRSHIAQPLAKMPAESVIIGGRKKGMIMPRTIKLTGRKWKCLDPECGAVNEVIYVSCSECDEEYEAVDSAPAEQAESAGTSTNIPTHAVTPETADSFIRAIDEAHKRTAGSTLHFGA
jgi:rubredoxin